MSTIREFVEKKEGKRVDKWWWESHGDDTFYTIELKWWKKINCWYYQCASLINTFCRDVYWIELWAFWWDGWAINWYKNNTTFPSSSFSYIEPTKIVNNVKKNVIPKRWDIIFFKKAPSNYNYWHIWVVLYADEESIYYLDQNAWSWTWFWKGSDSISIRKRNWYWTVVWYHRYKNIKVKVEEDLFDKIVHNHWFYIWEWKWKIKKEDAVEKIFYYLSNNKKEFNWKTFKNIWDKKTWIATRLDILNMILDYLNQIRWKKYKFQDLQLKWVWNWKNSSSSVTGFEFTIMVYRAFENLLK